MVTGGLLVRVASSGIGVYLSADDMSGNAPVRFFNLEKHRRKWTGKYQQQTNKHGQRVQARVYEPGYWPVKVYEIPKDRAITMGLKLKHHHTKKNQWFSITGKI